MSARKRKLPSDVDSDTDSEYDISDYDQDIATSELDSKLDPRRSKVRCGLNGADRALCRILVQEHGWARSTVERLLAISRGNVGSIIKNDWKIPDNEALDHKAVDKRRLAELVDNDNEQVEVAPGEWLPKIKDGRGLWKRKASNGFGADGVLGGLNPQNRAACRILEKEYDVPVPALAKHFNVDPRNVYRATHNKYSPADDVRLDKQLADSQFVEAIFAKLPEATRSRGRGRARKYRKSQSRSRRSQVGDDAYSSDYDYDEEMGAEYGGLTRRDRALCRMLPKHGWTTTELGKHFHTETSNISRARSNGYAYPDNLSLDATIIDKNALRKLVALKEKEIAPSGEQQRASQAYAERMFAASKDFVDEADEGETVIYCNGKLDRSKRALCRILNTRYNWSQKALSTALKVDSGSVGRAARNDNKKRDNVRRDWAVVDRKLFQRLTAQRVENHLEEAGGSGDLNSEIESDEDERAQSVESLRPKVCVAFESSKK